MAKALSLYDNQLTPKWIEPMTSFLISSRKKEDNYPRNNRYKQATTQIPHVIPLGLIRELNNALWKTYKIILPYSSELWTSWFCAKFYVRTNIYCSGERFQVFVRFTQCGCAIQNMLKAIVLFNAPMDCDDIISGLGVLPQTNNLLCFSELADYITL